MIIMGSFTLALEVQAIPVALVVIEAPIDERAMLGSFSDSELVPPVRGSKKR